MFVFSKKEKKKTSFNAMNRYLRIKNDKAARTTFKSVLSSMKWIRFSLIAAYLENPNLKGFN